MYKILFLKNERNDATDYYVRLIKKSLENHDKEVLVVENLNDIKKDDKVLTISVKAFFYTWLRNPKQFIIHWFQGVTPEEAFLIFNNKFQKKLRWVYLSFFEWFVLKFSKVNFFVSKAMLDHYRGKYNYNKFNYILMPCYNQKINNDAFVFEKYKEPTFVYAGSLSDWQCISETLDVFNEVQKEIPNSKMYLYTAEREKAVELIAQKSIENITVDYVPYDLLNERLKNIKYGFLLRNDILVNRVATPTKMNGYLANGVIPIYSDFIEDFKINLNSDYMISSDGHGDLPKLIVNFEKEVVCVDEIKKQYNCIFENYYSDEKYLKEISLIFAKYNVV
ncbi:glycosyltransferase family protein [Acinetobacter wuhouensis]|uniref:Glycosyltransferase family 1 protein n=1 Tax=Acinetobacter wuhouensis TaxID=1879050 RepID=A0A4Q7ANK1_9GAMM|nr:hypothetical protein [Acinetobacter wuhouensis]RZG46420.1 hypothetical protein EXU28_08985 [Acinetobacter wuhouensis]